ETEVVQSDRLQKSESVLDLGRDPLGDFSLAIPQRGFEFFKPGRQFTDRRAGQLGDVAAVERHRQRLRPQPSALAVRTDPLLHLPEAVARGAGTVGAVEAEGPRFEFLKALAAIGAGIKRAEQPLGP